MTTFYLRKSELIEAAKSKPQGYLDDVYKFAERQNEEIIWLKHENYQKLISKYGASSKTVSVSGQVGTELRKIISWLPVKKNCSRCRNLERKFNAWGVDKCEQNINRIVAHLKIAAKRRSIPTTNSLLTIVVKRAIRNARR